MNLTTIALVSDTHEHVRIITKAIAVLKQRSPSLVIHCGDIISPPVLERFSAFKMKVVFGNNDGERSGLRKKCAELGWEEIMDTLTFELAQKSFFVNHGTNPSVIDEAANSQRYDYVLHGHTHKMRNEKVGKTSVINPGALFMAPSYSLAFLTVESGDVEFVEIPD